ncbi:hypothetical protein ACFFR3_14705 [Nonomuraea salmonea]|uniref:Cell division protein FtsL n=1 Tax=Nonomuraea salmonea TaxID=46181 RepID=A0ABV5NKF1_9ACTN
MTTEQETGRGAPVRRAVPKTGTRRSAVSQQPKPRPRIDTRPEAGGKGSAAERARAEAAAERALLDGRAGAPGAARGKAPAPERGKPAPARGAAPARGKSATAERGTPAPVRGKAPAPERGTPAPVRGKAPAPERGKTAPARGKAAAPERGTTAAPSRGKTAAPGKAPGTERPEAAKGRARVKAPAARPAGGRGPARRQRTPFVLLVVGLLCGGLVSLLLLNTMLAQDTITDAKLREEIAVAKRENEKIDQEYQLKTQPGNIAKLAEMQGQHTDWDEVNAYSSAGDQASQADPQR